MNRIRRLGEQHVHARFGHPPKVLGSGYRAFINGAAIRVHCKCVGEDQRSVAASADLRKLAEARVDFLLAPGALDDVRREVVETMAAIDPAAYRIGAEAVWLADQRDRARAIGLPTLVICGAEDKVTPPSLSHALVELIPGAHYAEIAGAGHLTNVEKADEFNTLVEEFIGNG